MSQLACSQRIITKAQWHAEGVRRFGGDLMRWRFACPSCGRSASSGDWHRAGAPVSATASSCVSLWEARAGQSPQSACEHDGASDFVGNPLGIDNHGELRWYFDFAESAELMGEASKVTLSPPAVPQPCSIPLVLGVDA